MAEMTNPDVANALRARSNMDSTERNEADEKVIEQVSAFLLASAESAQGGKLKGFLNDIANDFIKNKTMLATGVGAEEEVDPVQAMVGAAMGQGGMPPGAMPPGGMPMGMPPGMPGTPMM